MSALPDWTELAQRQRDLAGRVELRPLGRMPRLVAGLDVHYDQKRGLAVAVASLWAWPLRREVAQARGQAPAELPYRSGFLSFREVPAALAALEELAGRGHRPELLLCDGQGIAHPQGCGLASHLGVLAELPAVGVAKSRLVGQAWEPGTARGDRTPLMLGGRQVGVVLRTRAGVKPLWVSPGHRITVGQAARIVLCWCGRYRQPEPLRAAHRLASAAERASAGPAPLGA